MALLPLGALPRYHAEHKAASAVALVHAQESLTWRELDERANQRARLYRSLGVKPGDFVTVALPNGNAVYETTFAIWKLGATPNMVSSKLPKGEAAEIMELVRPALLVAAPGEWPSGIKRVPGDADLSGFAPSACAEAPPAPYWKAMTSGGSTGRPKVIVDHMPAEHDPLVPFFKQRTNDVILNAGPLYHNASFAFSHAGIFCGAKIVNMSHFDAEEALQLIERHRVEWMVLVPTLMHRIWRLPLETRTRYDISSLRTVWHMAAAMPAWLKERWIEWLGPQKIWEMYGGTERQGMTAIDGTEWLARPGSVGRLITPGQVKVLRDDGSECLPKECGEIFFLPESGPGSTYHYIGAQARRIEGWESLGDLGWMDAEGYLFLTDRRSDLILRGGANIYPAEVEAALDAHDDVASCAVVGLPDRDLGQRVHAILQPRPGRQIDLAELTDFLAQRLLKYKLPESYEFCATPLRDDAGKARRATLRDEREKWLEQGSAFQTRP
jgi:bile acid-coenzyme A ligase